MEEKARIRTSAQWLEPSYRCNLDIYLHATMFAPNPPTMWYFSIAMVIIFSKCLCLCTSILGTHQTTNAAAIDESLVTSTCYHNRNTRRSAWRVIVTTTSFLLDSAGTRWQVSHGGKQKCAYMGRKSCNPWYIKCTGLQSLNLLFSWTAMQFSAFSRELDWRHQVQNAFGSISKTPAHLAAALWLITGHWQWQWRWQWQWQ